MVRAITALAIILLAQGVRPLQAQVDYSARLGVTAGTALVRDRIVDEIEVTQRVAPTLALGASLPLARRYRAGLEAALTTGGYRSSESGTEAHLGTIRTGSLTLGVNGPVATGIRWRLGSGFLRYWPAGERGIFRRGGTTRFLVGAGLDYHRTTQSRWSLMASLRFDFHRFTTDELQARGFGGGQGVQRVSATLGLGRTAR